ncbi:hypothetical protein BX600DRAFT_86718 [Xylariales sp. PMI_506]|nr:hypothetical protein BX600DRAFT_86718 [Xylariales sp. PMI_506]
MILASDAVTHRPPSVKMKNSLVSSFFLVLSRLALVDAQTAASTATVDSTGTTGAISTITASSTGTLALSVTVVSTDSSDNLSQSTPTTGSSVDSGSSSATSTSSTSPPDVYLNVPQLSVDRIELDVDNLQAEINLAAQVAGLVEINAGIQVGITKVNITIADVDAELELIIRLGNLVEIVNRTLASLDLNPLLINVLNEAGDLVDSVVGAVDGLLGSIVNGDSQVNFLIDNLGNIVQEVTTTAGGIVSSIIGDYTQNMTYTGAQSILSGGLIQKTYLYSPLNALVNIVFNAAGQVVQAVVVGSGSSSTSTTTAAASATGSSK